MDLSPFQLAQKKQHLRFTLGILFFFGKVLARFCCSELSWSILVGNSPNILRRLVGLILVLVLIWTVQKMYVR